MPASLEMFHHLAENVMQDFADGGHRVDQEGIFPHTAISEQKRLLSRLVHDATKDEDKQSAVQEPELDGDESKSPQDQASQCLSSSVDRIGGKCQKGSGNKRLLISSRFFHV